MAQKDAALRKRQLISQSNRTMFLWVAIASAVIGLVLVVSWFLFQQITYRGKVVSEKLATASILEHNNNATDELRNNIRALEADETLSSAKAREEQKPLEVILDALPADHNRLALGSSLQAKLVGEQPGVTLESLDVIQEGNLDGEDAETTAENDSSVTPAPVPFTLTVSADDPNALNDLLKRFERSVRTIDIRSIRVERSESKTTMVVDGRAFYLSEKRLELQKKTVPVKNRGN